MKNAVILAVVLAVVLWIIKKILRNPARKGNAGENRVSGILHSLPGDYHVINNVIVPNQQGTSQIDHVVVSPYGVFVIETKNFSGRIYGTENGDQWKETFRTTGATSFRNPIKQNWGHIYALAGYLNLDKRAFKPVIVFSNAAELKVETTTPVLYMSQLRKHILSYTQEIIPPAEVEAIYNRISKANLVGTEQGNRHIETVKENVARKETLLRQGKCPKCGGNLVLRKGKNGQFYGCSNYPKCKFTQNLRG